jgi:hypothetical protein
MIRRRLLAFVFLFGAAVASALFWNDGAFEWMTLGANLLAASIGWIWLHYRWKQQEAQIMTPAQAKDIFS